MRAWRQVEAGAAGASKHSSPVNKLLAALYQRKQAQAAREGEGRGDSVPTRSAQ
jgi:hypothetical protein